MKTYAEAKYGEVFDWYDFLTRAIEGDVTNIEKDSADDNALSWVTCACGNQCEAIPRDAEGVPIDKELKDLGGKFYTYVYREEYEDALNTLHQIEQRSAYLLNQIKK